MLFLNNDIRSSYSPKFAGLPKRGFIRITLILVSGNQRVGPFEYCTQKSSLSVICAVLFWLSNNGLKTGPLYEWNMSEIQTKTS